MNNTGAEKRIYVPEQQETTQKPMPRKIKPALVLPNSRGAFNRQGGIQINPENMIFMRANDPVFVSEDGHLCLQAKMDNKGETPLIINTTNQETTEILPGLTPVNGYEKSVKGPNGKNCDILLGGSIARGIDKRAQLIMEKIMNMQAGESLSLKAHGGLFRKEDFDGAPFTADNTRTFASEVIEQVMAVTKNLLTSKELKLSQKGTELMLEKQPLKKLFSNFIKHLRELVGNKSIDVKEVTTEGQMIILTISYAQGIKSKLVKVKLFFQDIAELEKDDEFKFDVGAMIEEGIEDIITFRN